MDMNIPYNASLTREPFLFYEMRTTACLLSQGISSEDAVYQIAEENLFQYPTEKTIKQIARGCCRRLEGMGDPALIQAIAAQSVDVAKQICLYALMKDSRLVREFMLTVVGEKYRSQDYTFGRMDLNRYFDRLQEQNDAVAGWSDKTITKLKQILARILVENEYLDTIRSTQLNPVYLHSILENAIRSTHDEGLLPAFNCFS